MDFSHDIESFDLVFLDVETTGLSAASGDAVCEIGALKFRNRAKIDTFQTVVNPQCLMSSAAQNVHGITREEIENAPVFQEVSGALTRFLVNSVVLAYNAPFDMGFLNQEMLRIGQPPFTCPVVDVLRMARATVKSHRHNLSAVSTVLQTGYEGRLHRALEDALVTSMVFYKIREILKTRNINELAAYISRFGVRVAR